MRDLDRFWTRVEEIAGRILPQMTELGLRAELEHCLNLLREVNWLCGNKLEAERAALEEKP